MKLRSSMTLFVHAGPEQPVFRDVLDHWFDGAEDDATVSRLRESSEDSQEGCRDPERGSVP
jgi:uncharacterized protein (DUF1810 family)